MNGATVGNGTDLIENIVFNSGVTTVTFSVISNNGNNDFCSFTVTITDNISPVISGPATFNLSSDIEECGTIPNFNITATDNCQIEEITYELSGELNGSGTGIPSSTLFPPGTTNLTITVIDSQNNSDTYATVITVIDDVDPIATCPEDLVVSVDFGSCQATLPCLLYTSPSPRDQRGSRMPSSA